MAPRRINGRVETPFINSRLLAGNRPGDPTERMHALCY